MEVRERTGRGKGGREGEGRRRFVYTVRLMAIDYTLDNRERGLG